MVLALPAEEGLGFLRACLVEGDAESLRRARRGRQRALALSICLQIVVVASLVLIPLLSNGERISLKSMTPLPPYARFGGHPQNPEPVPIGLPAPSASPATFRRASSPTIPPPHSSLPTTTSMIPISPAMAILTASCTLTRRVAPSPPTSRAAMSTKLRPGTASVNPSRLRNYSIASSLSIRRWRGSSAARAAWNSAPSSLLTAPFSLSK